MASGGKLSSAKSTRTTTMFPVGLKGGNVADIGTGRPRRALRHYRTSSSSSSIRVSSSSRSSSITDRDECQNVVGAAPMARRAERRGSAERFAVSHFPRPLVFLFDRIHFSAFLVESAQHFLRTPHLYRRLISKCLR